MNQYVRSMALVPILIVAAACSTADNTTSASGAPAGSATTDAKATPTESSNTQLDQEARTTLQALFSSTPKARELRGQAAAILVFPSILKAGFIAGVQGGNGVLIGRDGKTLGYYNASAVSYGLQAGVQKFSEAMFFMTDAAVAFLANSDGWSVGVGPSIVVLDAGMAKSLTTSTAQSDIYAFIFDQQGLMAGMGLQGQKITKLNR
jgi:lipid-binding SYLF domain-containing protein